LRRERPTIVRSRRLLNGGRRPLKLDVRFHVTRVLLLLLIGLVYATTCGARDRQIFVLTPTAGPNLLGQCSRPEPQNDGGFWAPTSAQIADLESHLRAFLASTPKAATLFDLDRYHRQYLGFLRGGKRFIYGNFYSHYYDPKREATQPVLVCDGGRGFWGIVYSVDSSTFSDFFVNGLG
jgi:hypothetical protein